MQSDTLKARGPKERGGKKDSPSPGGRGPPHLASLPGVIPPSRAPVPRQRRQTRAKGHRVTILITSQTEGHGKLLLVASSQVFTADTGGRGLKFTFLQRCPPQQKLLEHSSPPSPEKQGLLPAPPPSASLTSVLKKTDINRRQLVTTYRLIFHYLQVSSEWDDASKNRKVRR